MTEQSEQIQELPSGIHQKPIKRKQPATVAVIIRNEDRKDLQWYYRTGGLELFAHSPTQALLERANLYNRTAKPCGRCGGDEARWISGTGFVNSKKAQEVSDHQDQLLSLLGIDLPAAAGDRLCPDCDGRGWALPKRQTRSTEAITARPTGSSKKGIGAASANVGDANMARLGHVSKALAQVRDREGGIPAELALSSYFSPDGGSLLALWWLVPSGKTMLRVNPHRLPAKQLFANLIDQQNETPIEKRYRQFEAADKQANDLLEFALQLWNNAVSH